MTYYCDSEDSDSKIVSNQMFTAAGLKFSTNYTFEVQAISSMSESGPPAYVSVNTPPSEGEYRCDFVI